MKNDPENVKTQAFAARWIVPVSQPPINRGWVRVQGQRIVEVSSGPPPSDAADLGEVAILPGLVNAHTHLEFSDASKPIGDAGIPLAKWIGQVIASRGNATEESKRAAIQMGIRESIDAGVRLIGEIATPPVPYPSGKIDMISFAEVVGLGEERSRERLGAAIDHNRLDQRGAWSPHAPYSTSRSMIQSCVDQAVKTQRPLAMHVAESSDERELLMNGSGPFAEALRSIGVWEDGLFPWGDSPFVDLIKQLSAAPRVLLIHGNDLRPAEVQELAQHQNVSVVFCPRTHAFFGHDRHPVAELLSKGVCVALGTDSRASNPDLNLWREVQHVLKHRIDIAPDLVLKMASLFGAEALGRKDVGRIEAGCSPGLGTVVTGATTFDELVRDLATTDYRPIL